MIDRSRAAVDGVPGYLGIGRAALSDILRSAALRAGVRIHMGTEIEEFVDDSDAARVRLSDGRELQFDLVIGCEGLRSPLRGRLFGDGAEPVFTGYGCWRAMPQIGRRVPGMTKYVGSTTAAGLVPITADDMYLFHVTAEPGNPFHDPHDLRDLLGERLAEFPRGVVADVRDNLPPASDIVYSPLFEVRLPAPWHGRRAIVIGDAAHAVVPHLSQGGSQALEDAVALTEELMNHPLSDALACFMERRFVRARRAQDASLELLQREMTTRTGTAAEVTQFVAGLAQDMKSTKAFLDEAV